LPLSRYIHLNPSRTSWLKDADFPKKTERQSFLKNIPGTLLPEKFQHEVSVEHIIREVAKAGNAESEALKD